MISVSVTVDAKDAHAFLVQISGELKHPKGLNDALGRRLARELQGHFRGRNSEPNKMGAPKTNFWAQVAEVTQLTEATDAGAVVSVADVRYRIQLFGGTIKPTGGRKFLTIPIIKEARGLRVSAYEKRSGNKLFRLPGTRLLFERDRTGVSSTMSVEKVSVRRADGTFHQVGMRAKSRIRPVFALAESATIKRDPNAFPDTARLAAGLGETAAQWVERFNARQGNQAT